MGTTPRGYPYPEDTDPVAQGAQGIKALALKVDSTVGAGWRRAQYSAAAATNIPAAAYTKVALVTKDADTLGLTVAASVFTIPVGGGGLYKLSAMLTIGNVAAADIAAASIYRNGAAFYSAQNPQSSAGGYTSLAIPPKEVTLADGDTLELRGYASKATVTQLAPYASFLRLEAA